MATIHKVVTQCGLPSGEIADWSFWLNADTMAAAVNFVEAMCTALAADATWKAIFPSAVSFGSPKISTIDQATGEVLATSIHGAAYTCTGLGSSLPPQCSIVATLRTDLAGKSDTGRFYLPGPVATNTTSAGRMDTTTTGAVAARLVAAFEAGNGASLGNEVIVYSRTHRSITTVRSIDVGDVIDTQRRRRDKLVENRVVDPLTWL